MNISCKKNNGKVVKIPIDICINYVIISLKLEIEITIMKGESNLS